MPHVRDAVAEVAANHGVCTRPIPMRRLDRSTGEVTIVPVPCGATYASKCPACADRAKRLRMHQCREGWHLDQEPAELPDDLTEEQAELIRWRAELEHERQDAPRAEWEDYDALIRDADEELTAAAIRGRLVHPADPSEKPARRVRSTKRRQDTPPLPFRAVENRTVGRAFTGRDGAVFRPSTFLTLTCDSYGRVHSDGTPIDPASYNYRRAARDAVHFPALVDRFWQNLRRVVGYDVQYFAAVEPQRRLAPHLHAAIRGTFPRALLRAVIAATYHQVWWPTYDAPVYDPNNPLTHPAWDPESESYADRATGLPLRTWDEALDDLDADGDAGPVHVVKFGPVADVQGVTSGTRSAGKCIGYLTKYLTKSVGECHTPDTDRQRAHVDRLADALRHEPCSERCANWLLHGIQPRHPRPGMVPGRCSGKAHKRETLGFAGRRVLVSRRWSGKTLTDHRADRRAHVLAVLGAVGNPAGGTAPVGEDQGDDTDRYEWERARPTDPDCPPVESLVMRSLTQRLAWQRQYRAALDAQAATPDLPATHPTPLAA